MVRTYCDACKREITMRASRPRVRVEVTGIDAAPYLVHEYCDACYIKFIEFLAEFTGEAILKGQVT